MKPKQPYLFFVTLIRCFIWFLLSQSVRGSIESSGRGLQQYSYNNNYNSNNNANDDTKEQANYDDQRDKANVDGAIIDGLYVVGNSYIGMNDLADVVKNMLERSSSSSSSGVNLPIFTEVYSVESSKWTEVASFHREEFSLTLREHQYRWVVLQEQSEIPGLYNSVYQNEWADSNKAVKELDDWIKEMGNFEHTTQTILFQTWGRLHHDENESPGIHAMYDNFAHHQYRIAAGYREYQKYIGKPERPVLIAPVGFAFQTIHDAMVEEGLDPEMEGGKFANLYQEDGSHPSIQGSYLAASVLVGILTGKDPRQFDWEHPLVDTEVQKDLRQAAHTTIANFCQNCNLTPNKVAYVSPEERASSAAVAQKSLSFGTLLHFVFWCGVVGGGGFLAWKKQDDLREVWRNRQMMVPNRSIGSGNFGYSPMLQPTSNGDMDMELI